MKPKSLLFSFLALTLGGIAVLSPQAVEAQARPIPTREAAPPGREPYSTNFAVTLTSGSGTNGFSADPVPSNKRLVIEFVSVRIIISPNETPLFALNDSVNGASRAYLIPMTLAGSSNAGNNDYRATQLVRLYHDGNGVNGPGAQCSRSVNTFTPLTCDITLSGYLIDK